MDIRESVCRVEAGEGSPEAYSLDLIADQENVVLLAKGLNLLEVVLIGNDDSERRLSQST